MCGRFILVPRDVVDGIIQEIELNCVVNVFPDWPARRQSAYPKSEVPVVYPKDGRLKSEVMRWGYEVPWNRGVIFNTRSDTAIRPGSNMWAGSLHNRRCIVPTFGFFEPHRSETVTSQSTGRVAKQQYLFTLPEPSVLFIAGVFEGENFSLMTTGSSRTVQPVHDRMPVVLLASELNTWFNGDFESLFDRSSIFLCSKKETLPT